MKNERIAANFKASQCKTPSFPFEAKVRTAKSDFRERQIYGRIFNALIAAALIAALALAGSAANAQSSLTGENARELERLLAVPEGNVPVPYSKSLFTKFLGV